MTLLMRLWIVVGCLGWGGSLFLGRRIRIGLIRARLGWKIRIKYWKFARKRCVNGLRLCVGCMLRIKLSLIRRKVKRILRIWIMEKCPNRSRKCCFCKKNMNNTSKKKDSLLCYKMKSKNQKINGLSTMMNKLR